MARRRTTTSRIRTVGAQQALSSPMMLRPFVPALTSPLRPKMKRPRGATIAT